MSYGSVIIKVLAVSVTTMCASTRQVILCLFRRGADYQDVFIVICDHDVGVNRFLVGAALARPCLPCFNGRVFGMVCAWRDPILRSLVVGCVSAGNGLARCGHAPLTRLDNAGEVGSVSGASGNVGVVRRYLVVLPIYNDYQIFLNG